MAINGKKKIFTTKTVFNFPGLYSRMRPTKLSNHSARINRNLFSFICHAIENTANQITVKPLYYIQPSHHAPRACRFDCAVHSISVAWYKIVVQRSLVIYYEISHLSLVFSRYTHSPKLKACVYTERI